MTFQATGQVVDAMWTTPGELFMLYGETSVRRWADVENTQDQRYIDAKIAYAIEAGTFDLKARLSGTPVADIVSPPKNLRFYATKWVGYLLYEARGVKDVSDDKEGRHRLLQHKRDVLDLIRRIQAGQIVIAGATAPTSYPVVVSPLIPHISPNGDLMTPEQTQEHNDRDEKTMQGQQRWWKEGFES